MWFDAQIITGMPGMRHDGTLAENCPAKTTKWTVGMRSYAKCWTPVGKFEICRSGLSCAFGYALEFEIIPKMDTSRFPYFYSAFCYNCREEWLLTSYQFST